MTTPQLSTATLLISCPDRPGIVCATTGFVHEHGGNIVTGAQVNGIRTTSEAVTITSTKGDFTAKHVVNCTGLQTDRVTKLSGQKPEAKIVPFRGEFFELVPEAHHLCRALIYPVPDPKFPFLGVHFTRVIHGGVECGREIKDYAAEEN